MTLDEIANFCAETLGMTDNLTVAYAKRRAQARWKIIWNTANWKQAYHEVIGQVPANTEEVELPPEVELVTAVRINGDRELLPSSQQTQIMVDPAGFGNTGHTYAFSPVARSSAGAARIRLHRPFERETELLLICKRKCVELTAGTDVPLIPGADECIVAFTHGDLYRWQRQFSKANEMFQEARALLAQMIVIETVQAAQTVRLVPFTEPNGYGAETDWLVSK